MDFIRHCCRLSLYDISRKTYPNSSKLQKTSFWSWFSSTESKFGMPKCFFKNLASPVTRYPGQVSTCKKTNGPLLRKFSDGQTGTSDRQTDRQTDYRLKDERKQFHKTLSDWRRVANILVEKLLFIEMSLVD